MEALVDRLEEGKKARFLQTGILASVVINMFRSPDSNPVNPMDFVPGGKEEVDLTKMSPEKQAEYMMNQMSKRTYNRR